ncbi:class I SAM-dependent methyltransferase [Gillisia sp. JM1]|uniref:class I SAM-dependent methyltransferase n=1 Tax=Gillisia sp. JM1 TaxID=1283286 RepID=UPI000418F375|nr:class I SAM-dependent methyltransferase [Gillisia sp. JM1]
MDNFTEIPFENSNLDRWYIRSAILKSLNDNLVNLEGNLLDIGCGKMPYKEYILQNSSIEKYVGLDIETALNYDTDNKPDFIWNGKVMPFESNSFDCAFGTEVLEHCPEPELVLKEVWRILKPGGTFFFTVPFLWNLHEVPNDEYRYTPFALKRHLSNAGFNSIEIKATGGWHASMAQMLGLWVRRSNMPENKRDILSFFIKPIIKYLVKIDRPDTVKFVDGQMITGLSGIARK